MSATKVITFFYSWQSDLENKFNRNLIEEAIKKALPLIHNNGEYTFKLDQDTRDEPGAPDIKSTILKKISMSQFYICDVSIINSSSAARKMPNPNVLFELGYAVKRLGWERVIMVFNFHYGKIEDLPFDLRQHRPLTYDMHESIEGTHNTKVLKDEALRKLSKGIQATAELILSRQDFQIIQPDDISDIPEKIKRTRDVFTIKSIFKEINSIAFKNYYDESLSRRLNDEIFVYWYGFEALYDSPAFHIHDPEARRLVDDLYKNWGSSLNYGEYFEPTRNNSFRPVPLIERQHPELISKCFISIDNAYKAFKALCQFVNTNYIEIHIMETDSIAFNKNKQYFNRNT